MNEKKIYIVLTQTYTTIARIIKSITKDNYSHASISLDIKCNNMYSFGRKYIYFPFYATFLVVSLVLLHFLPIDLASIVSNQDLIV